MLLLLTVLACASSENAPAPTEPTAAVELAPVASATYRPEIELTGSLEPVSSVQLGFDVPGRMASLLVGRGAVVEKGQPLARLDTSLASAQVAQAEAAVAGAEAQLQAGEAAFSRAKALYEGRGMSEQQFQDVNAGVEAGRAGLAQAQAAARLARTHLGFHTLTSPIAGVVTMAPDNPGMVVGAGAPLFVVEDLTALQLKGTAPETATWLTAGLSATVITGSGVSAPATVTRVLPSLDPATRRLPVELRIDAPPEGMRAHSFARARIAASADVGAWSVPTAAVVARPDFVVFTLPQGAPDDQAPTKVTVEVVGKADDSSIVLGALVAGDRVVVDPPSSMGVE